MDSVLGFQPWVSRCACDPQDISYILFPRVKRKLRMQDKINFDMRLLMCKFVTNVTKCEVKTMKLWCST